MDNVAVLLFMCQLTQATWTSIDSINKIAELVKYDQDNHESKDVSTQCRDPPPWVCIANNFSSFSFSFSFSLASFSVSFSVPFLLLVRASLTMPGLDLLPHFFNPSLLPSSLKLFETFENLPDIRRRVFRDDIPVVRSEGGATESRRKGRKCCELKSRDHIAKNLG